MILQKIFDKNRIIALAGNKNTGKTNNLIYLIKTLPPKQRKNVYFYGLPRSVALYLINLGCHEIDSIRQLIGKTGCLFVLDEFQKLKLNDRRNKSQLNTIVDFIYHNKNRLLLSSPSLREFNTLIGGVVEKWLLKSISLDQCINGSQLKKIVEDYKGSYKQIDSIVTHPSEFIVINDSKTQVVKCEYVEIADSKANDGVEDFF